jgi:hypothetical protein
MVAVSRDKKQRKTSEVSIPTEVNVPPENLGESIITLYGRKGIGKTSLAAQFPGSLTCMFERGRRNLPILQVPQKGEDKLDWNKFKDYVDLFLQSDELQTLVVDTVDKAYEACRDEVCRAKGCTHPNDKNDYGKTWGEVKAEFDALLGVVQDSGKGLILISHEKAKPLGKNVEGLQRGDSEDTYQYMRYEPSCSKQAFEVIEEVCDFVFYYGFESGHRCLTVRSPNDQAWTSCGMDKFFDPDGVPINTFKVGSSELEAYETLMKAYNNEVRDLEYVPERTTPVFKKKEDK